jgi:hypothetical protein
VGAVGAAGHRYIEPVIHDHWNPHRRHQPPEDCQQLARARPLEPKLKARHAAALGGLARRHRVAFAQQAVVGDQHEPQDLS